MMDFTCNATWTNDCCGKQDLDFDIISADTRYWPDKTAECHIYFLNNFNVELSDYVENENGIEPILVLQSNYLKGDTEAEVKQKVKEWYNINIPKAIQKVLEIIKENNG